MRDESVHCNLRYIDATSTTKPFDPADLFAGWSFAGFWADLDAAGAVVYGTQPNNTDFDAELIGTGSWVAIDSTLSKEAGARTGGTGAQVLRVTCVIATYFANRAILTVGARYRARGWGRSGGVDAPAIYVSGAYRWTGTTSTAWQYFDFTFTATVADVLFGSAGSTVGAWVEYDDITIENLSVTSVTCKGTITPASRLAVANMPYAQALGAKAGLYFAADDGLVLGASKTAQRFLHDGTGCTVIAVVNVPVISTSQAVFGSTSNTAAVGIRCFVLATGAVQLDVSNGLGGAYVYSCQSASGAIVAGRNHLISARFNASGVEVYVDGLLAANDTTISGALDLGDAGSLLTLGNFPSLSVGSIATLADAYGVAKYASAAELANLHRYFADKHSIKLATDTLSEAELATWTGLVSWMDPNAVTISYNTQTAYPTAAASYTPSAAEIVDSDSADVPSGLTGTSIKCTCSDSATRYVTANTCYVTGNRHTISMWIKSDGTAQVKVQDSTVLADFTLPTDSASWVLLSGENTAQNHATLIARRLAGAPGDYYFKPASNVNLSITSIPERVGGGSYTQATAAYMPWRASLNNWSTSRFEGGDIIQCNRAASLFKGIHDGTGGTCVFVLRPSSLNASNIVIATGIQSQATVGWTVYYGASGAPGFTVQNGSGSAWAASATGSVGLIAANTTAIISLKSDSSAGVVLRVNGAVAASAALVAPSSANPTTGMVLGAHAAGSSAPLTGQLGDCLVFSRVLSISELYRLEHMLAAPGKWNVALP